MSTSRSNRPSLSVEFLAEREAALLAHLESTEFDPGAPSRLADWSIGHVLTHIARNADSHRQLLAGELQYGGSEEVRNAEIEAGADRNRAELIADVQASGDALIQAWRAMPDTGGPNDEGYVTMIDGREQAYSILRLRRCREIEIHRVDIGLGYELDDIPDEYVRRDLRVLDMQCLARMPMGMTEMPATVRRMAPKQRLAWLLGRAESGGIVP